jgi:hypothetical protein
LWMKHPCTPPYMYMPRFVEQMISLALALC